MVFQDWEIERNSSRQDDQKAVYIYARRNSCWRLEFDGGTKKARENYKTNLKEMKQPSRSRTGEAQNFMSKVQSKSIKSCARRVYGFGKAVFRPNPAKAPTVPDHKFFVLLKCAVLSLAFNGASLKKRR